MNKNKLIYKAKVMILAILAVFVMSSASWATTYYVDATNGNDGNNGTSQATAWKSIAKVNAYAFTPGDSILFKRGKIWNKTLSPPSSGAPGNHITFGAYGEGNKPRINRPADDCLNIWKKSYITVEHFHFKNAGDDGIEIMSTNNNPPSTDIIIQDCEIESMRRRDRTFWRNCHCRRI